MFEQVIFMVYHTNYLMGTEIPSLWIKQLRHEDDHSSPSSAKGKNECNYTYTPRTPSLHTKGTFTFYFPHI